MAKREWPRTKPVIVRWIDSMGTGGWDVKTGAKMEVITIGSLVSRTKDRVSVVMNRSHYGDGELIEIPTVAVKSVRRLKE